MTSWKYLPFFLLLLLFNGTVAFAGKEYFSFDQLNKFQTELFDYYPPTVCALKVLLGSDMRGLRKTNILVALPVGFQPGKKKQQRISLEVVSQIVTSIIKMKISGYFGFTQMAP
jgi:hypothetical protein